VDKTGGPAEREAFDLLEAHVQAHHLAQVIGPDDPTP
jgi:hypothetical protein